MNFIELKNKLQEIEADAVEKGINLSKIDVMFYNNSYDYWIDGDFSDVSDIELMTGKYGFGKEDSYIVIKDDDFPYK